MAQAFWQQEWFIWGTLLIVVFPLTTVILGEVISNKVKRVFKTNVIPQLIANANYSLLPFRSPWAGYWDWYK